MKRYDKNNKILTLRLVRISALSAICFIAQIAIAAIPNVELVSVLFLAIALSFPKDVFFVATIFTLLEGLFFGFGIWWFSYIYIWPLYCFIVILLKKRLKYNWLYWAIYSAFFGLFFGALTAIPYLLIDRSYVISYWIQGIPFDIVHCVSNFITVYLLSKHIHKFFDERI